MKTKRYKSKSERVVTLVLLLLLTTSLHAQSLLDNYLREGLKSNLVLQEKNLTLKQAEHSLQIARSYFLPSVNLLADYTSGEGGRNIAIPVGDMLNPVYATLNQMTQSDAFPQIENVEQNFFPKNFYDARIRTSMPLINTDLHYNKSIQGQQMLMKQYEVEAFKRQLVMEIKTSYYNLLSARAALKIYESAITLLAKNVEVNESLLANGKSLHANVIRSKSELERVKAELNNAVNQEKNARKYFNFLLNRELDSQVDTDASFTFTSSLSAEQASGDVVHREELKMLKTVEDINKSSVKMKQMNRLPKLSAFVDLGSQAYDWKVNSDSKYYLLGVQLSVPLFQGFRNNIGIRQGNIEIEKTQTQLQNITRQLALAADIAQNDLHTALQNFEASKEQLKSAQSYFNLVEKGYREGVNAMIEYLDARNQLTSSQLQQNLRQFEVLIAEARLERETASYPFEN